MLFLENIGRNKDINYLRTSWLLHCIANKLLFWAELCGLQFARLSSFLYYALEYLDLTGLKTSACDILQQVYSICLLPPFHFFKGYLDYATTFLNSTWMIIIGSMVLILLIACMIAEIFNHKKGTSLVKLIQKEIQKSKKILEGEEKKKHY